MESFKEENRKLLSRLLLNPNQAIADQEKEIADLKRKIEAMEQERNRLGQLRYTPVLVATELAPQFNPGFTAPSSLDF